MKWLLEAWRRLTARDPNHEFVVIGWGKGVDGQTIEQRQCRHCKLQYTWFGEEKGMSPHMILTTFPDCDAYTVSKVMES